MPDVILTRALLDAGAASPGFYRGRLRLSPVGWNRDQLAVLGVSWPACGRWKENLIGTVVSEEDYELFLALGKRGSPLA